VSPGTTHITVVVLPVRLWVGLVVLGFDSVCPVRLCVRLRCVSRARMGVLKPVGRGARWIPWVGISR
jgi:hypothetical protein